LLHNEEVLVEGTSNKPSLLVNPHLHYGKICIELVGFSEGLIRYELGILNGDISLYH
jgi:hypothetical protein